VFEESHAPDTLKNALIEKNHSSKNGGALPGVSGSYPYSPTVTTGAISVILR